MTKNYLPNLICFSSIVTQSQIALEILHNLWKEKIYIEGIAHIFEW